MVWPGQPQVISRQWSVVTCVKRGHQARPLRPSHTRIHPSIHPSNECICQRHGMGNVMGLHMPNEEGARVGTTQSTA
eukprot:366227-Chlamydomonas_euryale.AAC.29